MSVVAEKFLCDGAPDPAGWNTRQWDHEHIIRHQGPKADLNLRLENLSHRLLGTVGGRSSDLVRIAAYVYAADQMTSRGGVSNAYDSRWYREMALSIPVTDPAFWNAPATLEVLTETLDFLSEDRWEFQFVRGDPERGQLPLNMDQEELHDHPDCVVLFSGGADSLCAVIQKVAEEGRRPVLVSHTSTPPVSSRQRVLLKELRLWFPSWAFPPIGCWIHRKGSEPAESTQRTRAFLYASLGSAVADTLGVADVFLADNGIVSLNIPINDQLVGALATRSTHPKFIWLFNKLLTAVFTEPPRVSNPLWNKTRAETLDVLRRHRLEDLLQETNSCAHARGRPAVQPHCGVCSQCVDRRFAVAARRLEDHDLVERYGLDIFCDPLKGGITRTLAVSYVRFAARVTGAQEDDLFSVFPQLFECIVSDDPTPDATGYELTMLLKRHSSSVLDVMSAQIEAHSGDLAAEKLPLTSLIRLVAAGVTNGVAKLGMPLPSNVSDLICSEDFTTIVAKGQIYHFPSLQAEAMKALVEELRRGVPEVNQQYILESAGSKARRMRDLFKRSEAWETLIVPGSKPGYFTLKS